MPKTSTVLVDSEKGSRLSLPSTVRAPFTVTASSRATGCGREADSSGRNEVDAGAAEEEEGIAVKTSLSFVIGTIMTHSMQVNSFGPRVSRALPECIYVVVGRGIATIVRAYRG